MEVHELLTKGLEQLEKRGWKPEAGCGDEDRLCAWGALVVANNGKAYEPIVNVTSRTLADAAGLSRERIGELFRWNDSQTSFAPIKAAFCRAIEATSPTGSQSPSVTSQPQREREKVLLGTS